VEGEGGCRGENWDFKVEQERRGQRKPHSVLCFMPGIVRAIQIKKFGWETQCENVKCDSVE
jgi:hypothetical protein